MDEEREPSKPSKEVEYIEIGGGRRKRERHRVGIFLGQIGWRRKPPQLHTRRCRRSLHQADKLISLLFLRNDGFQGVELLGAGRDRKSTRLNSSHQIISYAVFCLKKKKIDHINAYTVIAEKTTIHGRAFIT